MLRAKVVCIISGSGFSDGKRRVELLVESGEAMYNRIRIPEEMLATPATLDAEVTLSVSVAGVGALGTAKKVSH